MPEYVLILSGDHIYTMDYSAMLDFHISKKADATIAVIQVEPEEASRFGIMSTDQDGRITEFEEKPANPKSNNASMGIYIFSWPVLREFLAKDAMDPQSSRDFGKDIIPKMLIESRRMYAYSFKGYWKDVGTIHSLWEANMDLLEQPPGLDLYQKDHRIYSRSTSMPAHYIGDSATVTRSIVAEGVEVYGTVRHSVLFSGAIIEAGAVVEDSVVMPRARVLKNAGVIKTIVGEGATVGEGAQIGVKPTCGESVDNSLTGDITLIAGGMTVPAGSRIPAGAMFAHDAGNSNKRGGE